MSPRTQEGTAPGLGLAWSWDASGAPGLQAALVGADLGQWGAAGRLEAVLASSCPTGDDFRGRK